MLHLDEGTVHAWLDGELPPDDAETAARHVATCAECQTLVAEARGLMAGASRIVSALDAGPAGVIPPAQRGQSSRRRPWTRFALTPMRMSIAATIIVAVGVTFTARRVADNSAVRGRMIDSPINAATRSAASPSADSGSAMVAGRPTGKLKAPASTPSPIASANADMSSLKAAASPAPRVSEAPVAQKAASADKSAVTDLQRQVAEAAAAASPAASPPVARLDSLRAKDEEAKVAVDSLSRAEALERRRTALVAGNASQLRGVATNQRDAEPKSVVVLRECYRLAVDSTDWRGVLPSGFALDFASSTLRTASGVAGAGAGAGGGAGPGAAPKAAAQPTNTALQFSPRATLNPVHALAANGRLDSRVIGFWFAVRADTIGVRFASADPGKAITVLLTGGGSNARVSSSDRTDSVRVARTPCTP